MSGLPVYGPWLPSGTTINYSGFVNVNSGGISGVPSMATITRWWLPPSDLYGNYDYTVPWDSIVDGVAPTTSTFDPFAEFVQQGNYQGSGVLWFGGMGVSPVDGVNYGRRLDIRQKIFRYPVRAAWDPTYIWPSTGGQHPPTPANVFSPLPGETIPPYEDLYNVNQGGDQWFQFETPDATVPADGHQYLYLTRTGGNFNYAYPPEFSTEPTAFFNWRLYQLPDDHPALTISGPTISSRFLRRSELLAMTPLHTFPVPQNVYEDKIRLTSDVGINGYANILAVPELMLADTNPFEGYRGKDLSWQGILEIGTDIQTARHRYVTVFRPTPDLSENPRGIEAHYY